MGHLVFFLLHIVLLLFAPAALIITIPLHLIYGVLRKPRAQPEETISSATHVRCPDCAELVRREATICKHCHCKLSPQ